ncbi:3-phosphoshikimate 1-carboxyvinyltransferase [Hydrogenoanaerobacterium sp.]|uniref:3-phosphoshikimate 1-carboxyvinyltransferase n=1 Tax=Hydrogenoanaerobacterium sp. TaxID=2953763 RepID=UPI00289F8226|nr:3-phosphoshikimate 1-carboxyvinyltransferase [Hydrogenoanaerobacterium sp.]
MIATVKSSILSGDYFAPPSKSDSHRALICAALANGFSFVSPLAPSEDIRATISALRALDADIQLQEENAVVSGILDKPMDHIRIFCNESGSTLRFLIPIVAAYGIEAIFTGAGKLPQRPLSLYHEQLSCKGVVLDKLESDELPLKITGKLKPGRFELAGNISSQFLTGLLFALPLLQGDSELILTSPLESKPYVDMTIATLACFGIEIAETELGYRVKGNQSYIPCSYKVEGDYSNAAFFAAAGLLSEQGVVLNGLCKNSKQGDREIIKLIAQFGGNVTHMADDSIRIARSTLHGIEIDAAQIPDLVPILAVIGTFAQGRTHIYHAHRLKIKESDRLTAMTQNLQALGADICCDDDSITVNGGKRLHGGVVSAYNDHRIAMSMAVAALFCDGEVLIDGAEAVNKSYPQFFEDYNRLGGCADVRMG